MKEPKFTTEQLWEALSGFKSKAEETIKDDAKMEKLFHDFEERLKVMPLGDQLADVAVFFSMVRACFLKQYDLPTTTIVMSVATLIYVVSPIDLIPDFIPVIGYADDIGVLGLMLMWLHSDIEEYKKWRIEKGIR